MWRPSRPTAHPPHSFDIRCWKFDVHADGRVLATLDKDFGELSILKGMPHSGIIRLTGFRAGMMSAAIHHIVTNYHAELTAGAIITADPDRIRIRTP